MAAAKKFYSIGHRAEFFSLFQKLKKKDFVKKSSA
jgi:hypothetical protein